MQSWSSPERVVLVHHVVERVTELRRLCKCFSKIVGSLVMFSRIEILSCGRDPARLKNDISMAFIVSFTHHIIGDDSWRETGNRVFLEAWDVWIIFFKFVWVYINLQKLLHLPFKPDIILFSKWPMSFFMLLRFLFGFGVVRVALWLSLTMFY